MSDYKIYDRYARRIIEFKDIANAHVVEARPLNDLFVEVRFNDGRHGVFDMKPYLKIRYIQASPRTFVLREAVCARD